MSDGALEILSPYLLGLKLKEKSVSLSPSYDTRGILDCMQRQRERRAPYSRLKSRHSVVVA